MRIYKWCRGVSFHSTTFMVGFSTAKRWLSGEYPWCFGRFAWRIVWGIALTLVKFRWIFRRSLAILSWLLQCVENDPKAFKGFPVESWKCDHGIPSFHFHVYWTPETLRSNWWWERDFMQSRNFGNLKPTKITSPKLFWLIKDELVLAVWIPVSSNL